MVASNEMVTILFTDLVGSTELLRRAGDEQALRIFKAHHRLLSEAVKSHGGHEVKWLGDGLMVAFPSASEALRCAIAAQRASRRPVGGERLQVRIGLHVGEALRDEADYFGTTVVVARRVCDSAGPGQIYASELVSRLLDGQQEFVFAQLGKLELKGVTEAVAAVEVLYQYDPLALLAHTPFVGRKDERAELESAFTSVIAGHGAIVVIAGEPGIGKTRLASEFSEAARARGAVVARGGCYEGDISAPYRPWVEALREYANARGDAELRDELGPGAPEVVTLVPELRERFPDIEVAPRLEAEAERLRLFDSITQFVRRAARSQPLLLFLDDLQWADKPSLLLLQHVARNTTADRLLLLGTYRDVEVDRAHPLAEALAELRRRDGFQRIHLRGLPEETVDELLAAIEPSEEMAAARAALAAALYQGTEGNPFFIREVLTHLIETGKLVHEGGRWTSSVDSIDELGIPEGVREVIGRRLSRLSDECNRMLTRASAMTGGFTWEELRAFCGGPEDELLDVLDEALGAQLLRERPDAGMLDFTHALIRNTLYAELSAPRRVLFHRQIAEALEQLYEGELDSHVAELAHHYIAATGSDAHKAIEYSVRAGERAMSLLAWEEAAQHYERARQAMELAGDVDVRGRCDLELMLGDAQQAVEQARPAVETYRLAARSARLLGDAERFARAAVGFENAADRTFGDVDLRRERLSLLDEALSLLGERESAWRARVLVARIRPAAALSGGGQDLFRSGGFGQYAGAKDPTLVAQAREALAMAERLGDLALQAVALDHLHVLMYVPGNAKERLALAAEQVRLARESGDLNSEMNGLSFQQHALLAIGDLPMFHERVQEHARRAEETRQPRYLSMPLAVQAGLAGAEGRLDEAERLTFEAFRRGEEFQQADLVTTFGGQLYVLRWLQGRVGEVEALFRDAARQSPNVHIYFAGLALICCELGRPGEAREALDRLAAQQFADIPEDFLWMVTMACLAEVCAALSDSVRAGALYALLVPLADLNMAIAQVLSAGSVSRSLGQLAAVLDRWGDAERHFQDAIEMNTRMGFRPWVAMTQLNYAQMLLRRSEAGDRARADALLGEALATAEEVGMTKVASDCRGLLDEKSLP